ncbi:hypothetical protein PINS_up006642 [Pythium insidiosum]|nr:hypothetical protein PINS_up006642 [Pythium insidiosum]
MRPDFPIPRAHLPTIDVSPQEHAHRQREVDNAVLQTIEAFQHYRDGHRRGVDGRMWKPVAGREQLSVFKERRRGTASTASTSTDSSLTVTRDGSSWTGAENERIETHSLRSRRRASYSAPVDFDRTAEASRRLLLVGEMPGRVESLLYALVTSDQEELALFNTYYYEDVADCALLNVMTPPSSERPLESLAYKWLVKRAPTLGRGKRHRDAVYVESCGLATMPTSQDVDEDDEDASEEETVGYHVMQSVRLARFPEWEYRNCTRMQHGVCFLFRQAKPTTVEVFALANVEFHAGHKRMALRPIMHAEQLLAVSRLMDIAEAKRLTLMLKRRRAIREQRHEGTRAKPGPQREPAKRCALCRQKKRFYNGVTLKDCVICDDDVCAKCRVQRTMFLSDGTLGRIQRIECCKSCAITAASTVAAPLNEPSRAGRDHVPRPQGGVARIGIAILDRFQRVREGTDVAAPSLSYAQPSFCSSVASTASTSKASMNPESPCSPLTHPSVVMTPRLPDDDPPAAKRENIPRRRSTIDGGFYDRSAEAHAAAYAMQHSRTDSMDAMPISPSSQTYHALTPRGLFMQMMELREVAESTYQTARRNAALVQQQQQEEQERKASRVSFDSCIGDFR